MQTEDNGQMKKNSILAVIPARGGSKGLPGKNIKLLNGKPLIAYTIEAALESGIFDKVIVSTDDNEIAKIAQEYGAEVPFVRPAELSGDLVSSDDVILHALEFYNSEQIFFDNVCKLQPTSPLRNAEHIKDAYKLLCDKEADFLVSVCECEHSPLWAGIIDKGLNMDNFMADEVKRTCRQDLPTYYRLNGAIYIGKTKQYLENKNFLGVNSVAYVMNQQTSVDIDSELDFIVAEAVMKNMTTNIFVR